MAVTGDGSARVKLLAHRGYAAHYPENTREAIDAAVTAGARFVEFDIQLSRDQIPYLLHDEDFRRTGRSAKRIFDLDAAEIANLSVGEPDRLGAAFAGARAPSLAELVGDLSGWPQVTAFVEIKRQSLAHFGTGPVLDAVLEALAPVLQQCVIISFELPVLQEVRRRGSTPIGWAIRTWDEHSRAVAQELQPDYLFCNENKLPAAPERLWAGNWMWVVYEITDPARAHKLAASGVGMIETMAIGEMLAALGSNP